jgi:hypothetical protein
VIVAGRRFTGFHEKAGKRVYEVDCNVVEEFPEEGR